ncbi:hypothetical protein GI364_11070 [Alicyclobacillus sp. SO9]|nr:hypothetical protein GI364_11070 [Alicyclobacillus sp. SO9]
MKPTVSKPAAEILVVNKAAGWSESALAKLRQTNASLSSLAVSVQSVTSNELQSRMDKSSIHNNVNLCIVVFPGDIPESAVQIAKQHTQTDFEFVGTSPAQGSSNNIAQVVPNDLIPAYIAGWLAASVNPPKAAHLIGMLTNGRQSLSKPEIEALFGGIYSADPTAVLKPDTKFTSSGTNLTGNSSTSSGAPKLGVPSVSVEVSPISANNATVLQAAHAVVFSAVSATGPVVLQPGPPYPKAVLGDLESVVSKQWKPGVRTVDSSPALVLAGSALPKGTKQALAQLNPSNVTSKYVTTAWKAIPKNIQKKWLAQVGL